MFAIHNEIVVDRRLAAELAKQIECMDRLPNQILNDQNLMIKEIELFITDIEPVRRRHSAEELDCSVFSSMDSVRQQISDTASFVV